MTIGYTERDLVPRHKPAGERFSPKMAIARVPSKFLLHTRRNGAAGFCRRYQNGGSLAAAVGVNRFNPDEREMLV